MKSPYQILPSLAADEHAALRADIEAHGVRVPIDVDEAGAVLDGHHRLWITRDLGIECPRRVLTGLSEEDKIRHALAVNVHRRQLTREQRRALVASMRADGLSIRAIGETLGVSRGTVASDLEDPGVQKLTPQPVTVTGKDGKAYPARARLANSVRNSEPEPEEEKANDDTEPEETDVPVTRKQQQRALPIVYREAVRDLARALGKVERLSEDSRFSRNRETLAGMCRGDLVRTIDVLTAIVERLPQREEAGA